MNNFELSLKKLKEHLANSTIEERDAIWDHVDSLKLNGPSVSQYFAILETSQSDYFRGLNLVTREASILSLDLTDSPNATKFVAGEVDYFRAA